MYTFRTLSLLYLAGKTYEQNLKKTDFYRPESSHTTHLPGCNFSNFMPRLLKSISTQTPTVQLCTSCVPLSRCAQDDCGDTPQSSSH